MLGYPTSFTVFFPPAACALLPVRLWVQWHNTNFIKKAGEFWSVIRSLYSGVGRFIMAAYKTIINELASWLPPQLAKPICVWSPDQNTCLPTTQEIAHDGSCSDFNDNTHDIVQSITSKICKAMISYLPYAEVKSSSYSMVSKTCLTPREHLHIKTGCWMLCWYFEHHRTGSLKLLQASRTPLAKCMSSALCAEKDLCLFLTPTSHECDPFNSMPILTVGSCSCLWDGWRDCQTQQRMICTPVLTIMQVITIEI